MDDKRRCPVAVWVITIYFIFSVILNVVGIYAIVSGRLILLPEQREYVLSLTSLDYGITFLIVVCNLTGVVYLLMLKKQAMLFFFTAFFIGLGLTVWHVLAKNFLAALGSSGLIGDSIGTLVLIAVLIYLANLSRKGILR